MLRIVIFGTGKFYQNRQDEIKACNVEIVAFIDNNLNLQGQYIDNILVSSPYCIQQLIFDKIILMSIRTTAKEMRKQLIDLGIDEINIWSWERFNSEMARGKFYYYKNKKLNKKYKKILIITSILNYSGASLAAVYAAQRLQEQNFNVVLMAPKGEQKFIKEISSNKINVVICPAVPYLHEEEKLFIEQFDIVVVNVFPMILCAVECSYLKPTYWWLHESISVYEEFIEEYAVTGEMLNKVNILAVSDVAKKNFEKFYNVERVKVLPYGIPDNSCIMKNKKKDEKIIFAIIGSFMKIKGHDILLKAVNNLTKTDRLKTEFWFIGGFNKESDYYIELQDIMQENSKIRFWGELNRKEMDEIYSYIDVVLNPSRQDACPIVVTEGMMHSKICVTTNVTGMAQYIEDGKNGFICNVEDVDSLCKKISWIISHKDELDEIRKNARLTYEKYFTMEKFGERLEKALGLKE